MPDLTTEPAAKRTEPAEAGNDNKSSSGGGGGGGGVKETVESILIAFILAFVFRAFVVEAFVIPTGSMATTLLGAHCRFHCPDCGYVFDLNYSPPNGGREDEDTAVPATAGPLPINLYCPNCGLQVPPAQTANPPVAYGDRILVLKYLYQISQPKRWDVVVFKAPPSPNQNYIKRLIGRPGEAILILDGDVYVRPPDDRNPGHFAVQAKPPAVQHDMWRLVYDNDFVPADQANRVRSPAWTQPWRVTAGTCDQQGAGGRTFAVDATATAAKLDYDPTANPTAQGFSDYLVYDQNTPGHFPRDQPDTSDIAVSDIDVRLTYQRTAGAGPFAIVATKRGHTFTAELTPTTATLYHAVNGGKPKVIGTPMPLPAGGRPLRVELSNADYQVTLRIDDAVAVQTSRDDYAPDFAGLLREYDNHIPAPPPTVGLRADGQRATVSHLSLWRDVYYTNNPNVSPGPHWATPGEFPSLVQQLGADEYFTMGDNSAVSWDARCWGWDGHGQRATVGVHLPAEGLEVDPGRVPGRFLLGKAFYVYWPAGTRATGWLPGIIPDFQGMRLIH